MKKIIIFLLILAVFSSFTNAQKNKKDKSTVKESKTIMNTDFIHWYGQSSIRIEDGKKQIYIDPFKLPSGDLPKADYILITHSHFDHYSPDDIERVKKNSTIILITEDLSSKISGNIIVVEPNKDFILDKVMVSTVPAYNLTKNFHPKKNNWVGYILTLSNKLKIYISGDTDAIPEMEKLKVDIAFVPIGGTYTMDWKEAADIINIMKPTLTIPTHYGDVVGTEEDAQNFKKAVKSLVTIKMRER